MIRTNHYEQAFEAFLRHRNVPYLAVSEKHRNRLQNGITIKTPDFLVSPPHRVPWIVDIKGRRFSGTDGYWKHWSTWDDLIGLRHWQFLFGNRFTPLFVFAYQVCGSWAPLPDERLFRHARRVYGFIAIDLATYSQEVKLLSARWNTYSMSTERFRRLAIPFDELLPPLTPPEPGDHPLSVDEKDAGNADRPQDVASRSGTVTIKREPCGSTAST